MREHLEDDPPHSRIFILHNKDVKKDQLDNAFSKYGTIDDIWPVVDRKTGESKGVTYIKYTKFSEAAAAMEEMNGVTLDGCSRPLKVIIASSRNEGSRRDENEIERLSRLFIMIPRSETATEESLKNYFSEFGKVEYVLILKNRSTNENKGFAYVKFSSVFSTAKALEECERKYKAILARPKEKRDENGKGKEAQYGPPLGSRDRERNVPPLRREHDSNGPYVHCNTRLTAFISTQLTEKEAYRLFDLMPGLEYCRLINEVSYRTQQIGLEYSSPETAEYAMLKLNGFEYPLGEPILIKPADGMGNSVPSGGGMLNPLLGKRKYPDNGPGDDEYMLKNKLANLTEALAEATSIIKAAGLNSGNAAADNCSVQLPPVQPILKDEDGKHRLFFVCKPEAPPMNVLRDVFCRFGNLVDCYLLPHRNCGYILYCNGESANTALTTMNDQELYGNIVKVVEADPPREPMGTRRPRYD